MISFDLPKTKTAFTRMYIGEAIVSLLAKAELKTLKILDVVKKAGVSRVTFYKYYATPQDALEDYLKIIISEFLEENVKENHGYYLSYEHILFALNFFDRYKEYFLTMKKKGLYSVLMDAVNEFMAEHIQTDEKLSVYKTYSYAGSLLNTFLMWEENGKKDSAESVARMIYELYGASELDTQTFI